MNQIGMTSRWIALVCAIALVVGAGTPAFSAKPNDDNVMTVLLVLTNTFDQVAASVGGTGPFYIGGNLFDPDTDAALGEFQCWGWFFTPARRMVTQEYNIGDRGTILLAGEEVLNPLAIIGGTGDFRNARGATEFEGTAEGVLVHFTLIGADAD